MTEQELRAEIERLARERDEARLEAHLQATDREVQERRAEAAEARIAELERDAARYRNGFANLMQALNDAPGLPLECLSQEELARWTDVLTGILMALGVLEHTGRPMSMWEALQNAAIDRARGE